MIRHDHIETDVFLFKLLISDFMYKSKYLNNGYICGYSEYYVSLNEWSIFVYLDNNSVIVPNNVWAN